LGAGSSSGGKKPAHKMEQLYLDFGQKSFGRQVHCARCQMMYTEGQPDDEAAHRAHHERAVRGALMRECDSERVVSCAPAIPSFL
jgi:N-acetyltransferase